MKENKYYTQTEIIREATEEERKIKTPEYVYADDQCTTCEKTNCAGCEILEASGEKADFRTIMMLKIENELLKENIERMEKLYEDKNIKIRNVLSTAERKEILNGLLTIWENNKDLRLVQLIKNCPEVNYYTKDFAFIKELVMYYGNKP